MERRGGGVNYEKLDGRKGKEEDVYGIDRSEGSMGYKRRMQGCGHVYMGELQSHNRGDN